MVLLPNIKDTYFPCACEFQGQECNAKHMTPQLYRNQAQHTWVLLEGRLDKVPQRKMETTYGKTQQVTLHINYNTQIRVNSPVSQLFIAYLVNITESTHTKSKELWYI